MSGTNATTPAHFRTALVGELTSAGLITDPAVAAAFHAVPREAFVPPGTPLAATYNAWDAVITKRDERGASQSSVSAPFIQARMIEQAEVRRGMSVLEVGSGGYNAALLAEVVGAGGRVVSIDIDPDVTARATEALTAAGYADRVNVVTADADGGVPDLGAFDVVIVTVGAWDIAPAWLAQLVQHGRLVLPLVMNGITRSIGFRRESDHLVSMSAEVCGFVPIQGAGAHSPTVLRLPDAQGHHVELTFDAGAPGDVGPLDGVLATDQSDAWSGVTISHGVSFADLSLWLACFLNGFCRVNADEGTMMAADRKHWFPFGAVRNDSFAYLAVRPLPDESGVEFGARAYGRHGQGAADALVEQIRRWNRAGGRGISPSFTYWPAGTTPAQPSPSDAVVEKNHGRRLTISWPAATS